MLTVMHFSEHYTFLEQQTKNRDEKQLENPSEGVCDGESEVPYKPVI